MFKAIRNGLFVLAALVVVAGFVIPLFDDDPTVYGKREPNWSPLMYKSWKELGPADMATLMVYYFCNADSSTVADMFTDEALVETIPDKWDFQLEKSKRGFIVAYGPDPTGHIDHTKSLYLIKAKVLEQQDNHAVVEVRFAYKEASPPVIDEPNPIWGDRGTKTFGAGTQTWPAKAWTLEYTKIKDVWVVTKFLDYKRTRVGSNSPLIMSDLYECFSLR